MRYSWLVLPIGLAVAGETGESRRAYGPWRLGMSRGEVQALAEYGPYKPVRATGGVETANGAFDGEKRNVAFTFDAKGSMDKIQVWAYEGRSEADAMAQWWRVYRYYQKTYGQVESPALGMPLEVNEAALTERTRAVFASVPPPYSATVQMAPQPMPDGAKVFASFSRGPMGLYFIFVNVLEP
jgi:hypothetical protein